jgi:hypothetical protein
MLLTLKFIKFLTLKCAKEPLKKNGNKAIIKKNIKVILVIEILILPPNKRGKRDTGSNCSKGL